MSDVCDVGLWALLPPLVSIGVAMLTREIIISLFLGVFSGALIHAMYVKGGVLLAADTVLTILTTKVGENMPMVIFLFLLGALVAIVTTAGGAAAYGEWAYRRLKSARGASLMTCLLGTIIFIDDYFNCLTVGGMMRPVTDRFRISKEKLAYFIDATAAPVCIMAPISSWAAYVISCMPEYARQEGMRIFIMVIPLNLYAILTLVMVVWIAIRKDSDYGLMRRIERIARSGHVLGTEQEIREGVESISSLGNGRVFDLVLPIVTLVVASFLSLLYYGGYWNQSGLTIGQALGKAEPGRALAVSSLVSIIVSFLLLVPRRVLSFHDFSAAILKGFKTMVPALVMLSLAWGLSGVCNDRLGTGQVISRLVCAAGVGAGLLPFVLFVLAAFFAFATGASWGVIGIMVPVVFEISRAVDPSMMVVSLAATLAGAVMGDHCSPIADTTILSSAGAGCRHMMHVATQMPYALTIGAVSAMGYIVAGGVRGKGYLSMVMMSLSVSVSILVVIIGGVYLRFWKRGKRKRSQC